MTALKTRAGHRFAAAPPVGGRGAPILALHKTGASPQETIALVRRIVPQAGIVAPEGNVEEEGRRRFFARRADGSFDVEDMMARAEALLGFVAALPEEQSEPVLFGVSHGANIGAAMLLARPGLFSGAIFIRLAGLPDALPSGRLEGRDVLMISGDADRTVPEADSTSAAERLARLGARLTHRTVPAGHAPVPEDIEIARDWAARVLPPPLAPTSDRRH